MKKTETTCHWLRVRSWLLLSLAAACGGTATRLPSVGSESHFLAQCDGSCEGGLDCIGGICTRPCFTDQSGCGDLAASAACTNQSVEPGRVAVCDVSCATSADCRAVGSAFACSAGYCRQAASSGDGNPAAGGGVPGVNCQPAGRYQVGKEGGYLPCCAGLTELSTRVEAMADDGSLVCLQPPLNSYSCIRGSCGDGICEEDEGRCGCPADCPASTVPRSAALCDPFRDQSPPPDVRTISITNTGAVPLYIVPERLECQSPTSLLHVEREGQAVNVIGLPACGASCQAVQDEGPSSQPQRCAPSDCGDLLPIMIQPGQTLQQPVNLEVVAQTMPQVCIEGAPTPGPTVACFSRVIPQPGNYSLSVRAITTLECDPGVNCECQPDTSGTCTNRNLATRDLFHAGQVLSFPSSWYFQSQELSISAPPPG